MKKRFGFSLVEVVIASMLILMAMTACFSLLLYVLRSPVGREASLAMTRNRWQAISRIRTVMGKLVRGKKYPFVLETADSKRSQRLIFAYNNGVDPDPKLSNEVLAMLCVEKGQGLVLSIRSAPERAVIGQEEECSSLIWPEAQDMTFEFLPRTVSKGEESAAITWQPEWKSDELPAFIRMKVRDGDGTATITCVTQPKLAEILLSS